MQRIQLFEFEDFHWFPSSFRSTMTKLIVFFHILFGTKEVLASLISDIRKKYDFNRIVDLGSGTGGVMPMVIEYLNKGTEDAPLELLLTDLYPDKEFIEQYNVKNQGYIFYRETPLDARNLYMAPKGLKTMVNCFHHMRPEVAREILKSSQLNNISILIYEMGENMFPLILWWLFLPLTLPLMALIAILYTPFVKPIHWKDILFSWVIPVVPICFAWDGLASEPRVYTFKDIEELLPLKNNVYTWEVKNAKKKNGKTLGYYILGLPN
ncbi:hypothetical protein [Xanthovirga aplysinae]|uniref:hypothetical protein n=1 Tax=Xanthovirga aplysinae TaxID=2529853 RepID=UPI001656C643|nr:hypothetical protein [Xanthovirga aplysinae]MTI29949.1 hypothetical protein [Xanthovirga aplysinae]